MQNKDFFKIENKNTIFYFLLVCFLLYVSTYFARLNYSASLTEIIRAEGFSKGQTGFIGTVFFFTYGIGQFISGFLGDKFSPKKLVFLGTFISSLSNFFISFIPSYLSMCLFWSLNGIAQALIWSPMLRAVVEYLKDDIKTKACVYLNMSVPIGSMFAYGMTAGIIGFYNWKVVFLVSGIILLIMSFVWLITMTFIENHTSQKGKELNITLTKDNIKLTSEYSLKNIIVYSGIIYILFSLFVQGILKDGVTTWIPTYIDETYNVGSVISIISTMLIPASNIIGVSVSFIMNVKIFKDEIKTSIFFFILCTISLFILWSTSGKSMAISLIALGVSTTCMMSVNTMLIACLPSHFTNISKVSSLSGLLNSVVYLGSAVSIYGIGSVSSILGWKTTIFIWIILSLISTLICLFSLKKWTKYKKNNL